MSENGISTLSTKQLKQVAKLDYAQHKRQGYQVSSSNGSVSFNGSSQYLSTSNAGLNLTGDFTVEGWFYPTNVIGAHALWTFGQASAGRYTVQLNGTALLTNLYGAGSTNYTSTVPINTWTHIAMVRLGTTVKIYINGTASVTTDTQSGTIGNGGYLNIGADDSGAALFAGNISNFRVVKGTALYTETFTPINDRLPVVTNTSLLLNTVYGSNFLVDYSANAITVSNIGSTTTSSFSPTTANTANTGAAYYRTRNIYDITLLPTQYSGNDVLNNNNDRGLVEGRPWGFSLPIQLFAAGENGAWFDVNDIATLFQDSAGTIRVSAAGDPVGKILDKSGNNNHASQSTAGKRPIYRVDANGYAYLEFDGVNDFMSTSNINLTSTAQVTASVGLSVDSGNYVAGFTKTTYSGYHGEDPAFSDSGTISATTITSTVNIPSESTTTTELYIGYILADYTGTWTFALTSDDGSYLWIGDNAISGYTTGNAFINNGGLHGSVTVSSSISLTAGQYYPIRLLSGNNGGPGVLNLTYAHTGQSATNDFTGIAVHNNPGVAICTGSNPNSVNGTFLIGAPSAIADHSFYLRGTTTIIARVPNEVTGDDILTGLFDISQSTKELELIPRLNGVVSTNIVWSGTNAGTGNFGNQPLYIGSLGGTGTFFKGKIYGVIVRGASSTASEISNIEAWVDGILN